MSASAAGWLAAHGVHTAVLGAPIAVVAVIAAFGDVRAWLGRTQRDVRLLPAAVLSFAAAAVHLTVCPQHFGEGFIYGLFFAVTASMQIAWAALACVRVRRWLARIGAAGSLALVALWMVTRTIGIPLGPERGEVEAPGALDIVASACEIGVAAVCIWVLVRMAAKVRTASA